MWISKNWKINVKERNKRHSLKSAMSRGRARFSHLCLLLLLCLVSNAPGINSLSAKNSSVWAARHSQTGNEGLKPSAINLPPSLSFGEAFTTHVSSKDRLWQNSSQETPTRSQAVPGIVPKLQQAFSLNESAQRQLLRQAPMEFTNAARDAQVVMALPMPDGTFARFRVEESPVMAPKLAARFPEIKTYRGQGIDDPTATTRFDVAPAGFHAIVLSANGTVVIEPDARADTGGYISYNKRAVPEDAGSFHCLSSDADQAFPQTQSKQFARGNYANLNIATGTTLRTYRLALAATAEFTQTYGGGTVGGALSALTTTINGINAIYERDLAIHLQLIDNETSIIFTNPATDGYTSDNATAMFNQNQTIMDRVIGPANYDIGMVFDGHVYAFQPGHFLFEGQGLFESVGVNGIKGKGVTILRSIEPSSTSAIWVVAHEMGHKFGALHTFNSTIEDCGTSRTAAFAYEPGSGSTIMGYRGGFAPNDQYLPLCGGDDLRSTDTYFHAASIEQIINYTTFGRGNCCPTLTDTGNTPPTVDAGSDYTIPASTPFKLTATGSDSDGDTLTYTWEQFDLGAPGPPHTDNGNRPIFRSFAPVLSAARTFPQLSDILSGTSTFGESLPTTTRTMNFRVTARDNHPGGSGINIGAMRVNVVSGGGAFAITQPSSSATWVAGSTQTVTWNVADTSNAPISCANVRILLSLDGGNTFPVTLASSTPNTGTATVIIPNTPTSTARIKVEAVGNIFFNISLPNFTITGSANSVPPTLLAEENTNRAIALDSVTFMRDPFPLTTPDNFSLDQRTRIMLFAIGLELMPGEDAAVVTAQAEDSAHRIYPLTIEYVGKVPNFDWLTQVNVRLPDGLATAGDVLVSISLRGAASNKVVIGTR